MITQEVQKKIAATPLPSRKEQLLKLQTEDYDVLVIGGGATGCGVVLDSTSRGMYATGNENEVREKNNNADLMCKIKFRSENCSGREV